RTLAGTTVATAASRRDTSAARSLSCGLHARVCSEPLDTAHQGPQSRQLGGCHLLALGGEAVVAAPLFAELGVVASGRLFDEAVAQKSLDGAVQGARAQLDRPVAHTLDVAHQRVAV